MTQGIITLGGELSLENLEIILEKLQPLNNLPSHDIVINLERANFIYPSAITLLGTLILRLRQQGCSVNIIRPRGDTDDYLNRINFYELIELEIDYQWNRHDSTGRFMEIRQVKTEKEGDRLVGSMVEVVSNRMGNNLSKGVSDALQYALLEILNNVFHHANSPTQAILCVQSYPGKRYVELSVTDSGCGIRKSLSRNLSLPEFDTDPEAIKFAVQPKTTGNPEKNAGEGLFFTLEAIKENKGDACIYSYKGLLYVSQGVLHYRMCPLWEGTGVVLRFCTTNPIDQKIIFGRYAPSENEYDWIF